MKSSRNLKVGVILLVVALAVGVFALVVWADGNGTDGVGRGASGNIESPRYGMQSKDFSNQVEGLGNEMSRKGNAPDDDGDGIPNGQDDDYETECDDECDDTCDSEPKGSGMRRNSPDDISGLQTHVNGMEMKTMTITEIAALWGIDSNDFLAEMTKEFNLQQEYSTGSTIDDLRGEYRFSPYQIMEIAERIKAA
jgi:hypothetical protein